MTLRSHVRGTHAERCERHGSVKKGRLLFSSAGPHTFTFVFPLSFPLRSAVRLSLPTSSSLWNGPSRGWGGSSRRRRAKPLVDEGSSNKGCSLGCFSRLLPPLTGLLPSRCSLMEHAWSQRVPSTFRCSTRPRSRFWGWFQWPQLTRWTRSWPALSERSRTGDACRCQRARG